MRDDQVQVDFYQRMRASIRAWLERKGKGFKYADYLLAAPDLFHLLCRLAVDPEVPAAQKAKLAAPIIYFIAPLDLIPEALLGPYGYVDDLVAAALVLNGLVNEIDPQIIKRHWAGSQDILTLIQEILKVANELVGKGLLGRIKGAFGSR